MGVRAKVITLKLKHDDFQQTTRRITIHSPTQSTETIYRVAAGLLDQYIPTKKIRLVGVGASGFISAAEPVQMDIFDKPCTADGNWEKVDKILDRIDKKFGKAVVHRASLPKSPEKDPD